MPTPSSPDLIAATDELMHRVAAEMNHAYLIGFRAGWDAALRRVEAGESAEMVRQYLVPVPPDTPTS